MIELLIILERSLLHIMTLNYSNHRHFLVFFYYSISKNKCTQVLFARFKYEKILYGEHIKIENYSIIKNCMYCSKILQSEIVKKTS